jgi:Tfp pilus assembly protein PilF
MADDDGSQLGLRLGADHLDTLGTVENLETVYQSQGRYKEAEQRYRWALKVNEK